MDRRPKAQCRVAFYSHDTMGLGHIRRNLLLAQILSDSGLTSATLLVAGAREAGAFSLPSGADCLTLPALYKQEDGRYRARGLDLPLREVVALRARVILAALKSFEPDVLIVDKVPRGALGELEPTLNYLRSVGRSRCVLGLRDVLDDPSSVRQEWSTAAYEAAIGDYYDAVWVYGDPAVFDPIRAYRFSDQVAARVRYSGYLGRRPPTRLLPADDADTDSALGLPPGRLALCLVGGGQDGAHLASAFAEAQLPADTIGVIVTGPFMPPAAQDALRQRAARHPCLRVMTFLPETTRLLGRAESVVAMGGYNTVCELLSQDKRALIVPRVTPRTEQLIRTQRLVELGLLDMLHPKELNPRALTNWLAKGPGSASARRQPINLGGRERIPQLLTELVADRAQGLPADSWSLSSSRLGPQLVSR